MGSAPICPARRAFTPALFSLSGMAGSADRNPTLLTNGPAIPSFTMASESALPSVPYQRTDVVLSCCAAAWIICRPSDSKLASRTATPSCPYSADSSAMRLDRRDADDDISGDSGLYLMPSSTLPPSSVKWYRMAASSPSPHASPRQTGMSACTPSETATLAAMLICVRSLGTSLNMLSPGTASEGAVEQHPKTSMSLASTYPLMLRMLELVSGPLTRSTSLEWSAWSFSSACTGLVAVSSVSILSVHFSPLSSRYRLKSSTARLEAASVCVPMYDMSPVSGVSWPMVISPESAVMTGPASSMISSPAGAATPPVPTTARVARTEMAAVPATTKAVPASVRPMAPGKADGN